MGLGKKYFIHTYIHTMYEWLYATNNVEGTSVRSPQEIAFSKIPLRRVQGSAA